MVNESFRVTRPSKVETGFFGFRRELWRRNRTSHGTSLFIALSLCLPNNVLVLSCSTKQCQNAYSFLPSSCDFPCI